MSDSEYLQQFVRENSQTAFAALVDRHVGLVYSAALRQVRSSQLAEEIAQSVFLDLSRRAAQLDATQPLAAWLYFVTRRTAVDVIRRESRRQARERTAAEIAVMKETPPHAWPHVERSLDDAMETLNETERTAILLRYFKNQSLRQVGESLGISEDTAQKRVSRAVEQLRTFFLRRGVTITAAILTTDLSAHVQQIAPMGIAATITAHAFAPAAIGSVASGSSLLPVLMTMKTTFIGTAAILTLFGIGWAWYHIPPTAKRSEPPALVSNKKEEPFVLSLAASVEKNSPPPTVAVMSAVSRGARPSVPDTPIDPMEDPVYRQSLAAKSKTHLADFYDPLFKNLSLTPDQLDAFKNLLVKKQFTRSDAARAARTQSLETSDELFYTAIEQAQHDEDREIKALLGDDGFAVYADYEKSFSRRIVVNRLADAVRETEPLSEAQVDQLVRILTDTGGPPTHGGIIGMGIDAGSGLNHPPFGLIGVTAIRRAKPLMSPTQWQAMNDLRTQLFLEKASKEN